MLWNMLPNHRDASATMMRRQTPAYTACIPQCACVVTCGTILSCRLNEFTLTPVMLRPPTLISPSHGCMSLNSATNSVLLPLPVRPTTPTFAPCSSLKDTLSSARGREGAYLRQMSLNSMAPVTGHWGSMSSPSRGSRGMSLMYLFWERVKRNKKSVGMLGDVC